jgi:putative IMPACT (imprinted ancient) family translation regulator
VSDALVLVVRWFGGTKLGKGGLARAYAGAAKAALDRARWLDRFPTVELLVEVPYDRVGAVKHLVNPPEIELVSEEYGKAARIVLRVAAARQREIEDALKPALVTLQSLL